MAIITPGSDSTPEFASTPGSDSPPTRTMDDSTTPRPELKGAQVPIAVIGMACRLPGNSNSPEDLWTFLQQGGCANNEAPETRFNLKTHFDGSRKPHTLRSPGGMFLENIDLRDFDAQFFAISKPEAIAMDPQQRQLLEVVYECLENAGVSLQALSGAPVGCFVGSSTNDYRDLHARDPEDRPPNATVGLVPAILSNRISHFLNIKGPSMTIDTACSASLVSLDVACKYMQAGEISAAIVAGCHLYLSPEHNMDSGAIRDAFSPSGKCHTFDAKADGYIKAEGINAVLLKRLDDAIRDGDPIRAIVRGSATNSDGRTPGIASPSVEAQAAAIRAAYANAGITDLAATSYLECHGTGTQAGDPVEVEAASSVLCGVRDREPLIIGSIKSNIGHSECSAGISGLLKAVLAIEKGLIPGNPTFVKPNPKIDFEILKVRASRTSLTWPKVPFRRASVNSFGFGGSNAHVVLEETKMWAQSTHVSSFRKFDEVDDFFAETEAVHKTPFILVFSGNDEISLQSYVKALRKHLIYPGVQVDLPDLAFTLSERRTHHFHRAFVVTNKELFDSKALISGKKNSETPRIGFVFTGQGAQWPQMGRLLVENFPLAGKMLRYLDTVLQQTPIPPVWSLIGELTEPRSAEILRHPELSQPLVTALQMVIVKILRSWGIHPQAVVGHSSGEIAAAYCAGHLSMEDAIKAAFYRGQASVQIQQDAQASVGMLAVGIGAEEALNHLGGLESQVEVACYNSPNSVTLSGSTVALKEVKARLEGLGHFARMLQVDLAYHSRHMESISDVYKGLLDRDFQSRTFFPGPVKMFSSVSGHELDRATDSKYWQTNMAAPVIFDQAVRAMTFGREGADFLIEIGPTGALSGPISEIKLKLPQEGLHIQYCTAIQRGQEDLRSLYEVAGRLFISGANIDTRAVNRKQVGTPSVIVDLPNYVWNHSTQYWHESEASKDWRYRLFPHHDLIGSKVLGTSYYAPVWKKALKVDDLSWLKDHKLGSDIVVPGAALVVMAVEAMAQLSYALHHLEGKPLPERPCYRVRNATFSKALVLEEGTERNVMIGLGARIGSKDSWHEFKIHSLMSGTWVEHSRGLVRVEQDRQIVAPQDSLKPLMNSTPGHLWYKAMEDVGYALGPAFQKHLEAESLSGTRTSRSIVSLAEPQSTYAQSTYQMHPTSVDGILQACAPALWNGNRTNINAVLIPAIIDDVLICSQPKSTTTGIAVVSSSYSGLGDRKDAKNYTADVNVYDLATGVLLLQLSKLRTNILDTHEMSHTDPTFCCLTWKPDITFVSKKTIAALGSPSSPEDGGWAAVHEAIDLIAYKTPNLKVFEGSVISDEATSIWLDSPLNGPRVRSTCEFFRFGSVDAKTLLSAQEKYGADDAVEFSVIDITNTPLDKHSTGTKFDLVIARLPSSPFEVMRHTIRNCHSGLREGGHILILQQEDSFSHSNLENVAAPDPDISRLFDAENFSDVHRIPCSKSPSSLSAFLATCQIKKHPNQVVGGSPSDFPILPDPTSTIVTVEEPPSNLTSTTATVGGPTSDLPSTAATVGEIPSNVPILPDLMSTTVNVGKPPSDISILPDLTSTTATMEEPPSNMRIHPELTNITATEEPPSNASMISELTSTTTTVDEAASDVPMILDLTSTMETDTDISSQSAIGTVHLLRFSPASDVARQIHAGLRSLGWDIVEQEYPFDDLNFAGTVLVLDDLSAPLLSTIGEEPWAALQALSVSHNKILWMTEGSQFQVTKPENAMIHGLIRTIRDEDPSINFTTLDVESGIGEHTVPAIHVMLKSLQISTFKKSADYEFAERRGNIYISRVFPDYPLNDFTKEERYGAELVAKSFHNTDSQIRLICERVGLLDSLHLTEVESKKLDLQDNEVEIEIAAVGVNFKDIAISTGLIPGNQRLLGYEGAGTVVRSESRLHHTGQRVLFVNPGSFANRITVVSELVQAIPDSMSFEEAATLGAVYPVALYSLFDMANTRKGQRVLIHSAAGGLGIACIQVCQYIGADVYATVGNDEKRNHLVDTFGIPSSKIFNSRSTLFAAEVMNATGGEGVDVIINSLTGDLLEESWHCIRDGGTMVELGKRDIIERNYLPMEPFSRNVSYRSFDISHKSVAVSVLSRLLEQTFQLVGEGHIKPIYPITVFPFEEITSAFRYMQSGKHMGKIVISNGSQTETKIPIRSALRVLRLRDDVSYLIVGGLKGLCGSMALSFARHGARHIVVMGRSGFDDKASQTIVQNIQAEGCKIYLVVGDCTIQEDVRRAFKSTTVPVGGIVQGAMVVRGKLYPSMTADDFHVAVACKVVGTWNLHNVALEENLSLDFFSLLSSTSGVAGQSGQANYVAANAFLDAFAIYRRSLGLAANSIALGPMWDVGYMSRNKESLPQTNTSTFTPITEGLFHKIMEYSVLQQVDTINPDSVSHLITGMAIPLKDSSTLRSDARFTGLFGSATSGRSKGNKDDSKELQVFNLLYQSQADAGQILNAAVELIGKQLMTSLRLSEPIEPAKPLSSYGMESLAAVELRNWVRMELEADLTMLEIFNANSLIALCEKIIAKMQVWGT